MQKSMLLAGCLLGAAAWASPSAPEHVHAHAHDPAHAQAPADGARHATDAPLRAGMLRIRELLGAARPVDAAAAGALADGIDTQVQQLFASCKLEPEADAALHGVLALLLEGAAGLRADAGDDAAWGKLREALVRYPQLFVDTGFGLPP